MPFDFDESDLNAIVDEPQQQEVAQAVQEQANFDTQMSEVERRLELAQYYRLLLNDSLFNNRSEAAATVEAEVRDFVRSRLEILLGVKKEQVKAVSDFNDDEIQALKAVASRLLKKPELVDKKPKEPPALGKKTHPDPAHMLQVIGQKEQPSVKKAIAPQVKQKQKPQSQDPLRDALVERLPPHLRDNPDVVIEGDKVFMVARDSDGNVIRNHEGNPIRRNITPTAKPKGVNKPRRTPTIQEANAIMAQQANQMLSSASGGGLNIQKIANAAMTMPVVNKDE